MIEEPPTPGTREPASELIAACSRGDRQALGRLFEDTRDRVYSLALHLSGDEAEAADITQDVFLKLLTRLHQYRADARFTTWLHRIVVNTFCDRHRARRRLVPLETVTPPPAETQPERDAARAETARLVSRAVATLPPKLRLPLVLRFVAGLSYGEIAGVLGLPPGTVASRLSRALAALAHALPDQRELEV